MAKIIEHRKEVVRYGTEEKYLKELAKFGWVLSNKKILNRFGNPLPLDEKISESDLKEKCFYELDLLREIDDSVAVELHSLQAQYDELKFVNNDFGGGRVTGCVFLTLLSIGALGASPTIYNINLGAFIVVLFLGLGAGAAITAIFASGIGHVVRANKDNEEIAIEKKRIAKQAQELLNKNK